MKKAILAAKFIVSLSSPPLESKKGIPFLSQNRQFQWTNTGNVIYPVIPASAATLLKSHNYQVFWDDAVAEGISYQQWLKRLLQQKPNLVAIETKTPVIQKHWQIIDQIKKNLPQTIIVLMGDHVTALPMESFKKSKVDYILTGGDYDFMLLNLANHLTKLIPLEPGFYYRSKKSIQNSGIYSLKHHHLDNLPIIDRKLTAWQLYAYHNTNFKFKPGAYTMFARDCWWGKCSFCSWTTLYPGNSFRTVSVARAIEEVKLLTNLGVKEIFDDSGTLPIGAWLNDFCHQLISLGLNKKITLGCNMRFGALTTKQLKLMKRAGFRFLLYGLESANQKTLDKINKNTKTTFVIPELTALKKIGLEPHITIMIGYPWETKKDAQKTVDLARRLFHQGLADSLQATIVIPYPGTPLYTYSKNNRKLLTKNWDNYDMRQPVMKTPLTPDEQKQLIQDLFRGVLTPKFLIQKILSIRSLNDIKHLAYYSLKFLQKLKDFNQ